MFAKLSILIQIALRNLFASLLNVFIGAILFFGTALMVVGGSIFDNLDESLSNSIVGSVTGHLQVYSGRSKDQLEVYGKMDGSDSNLAPIDDFPKLKAQLLAMPNVATVLPMGTSGAMIGSGNTIDLTLEKLRNLYRDRDQKRFQGTDEEFKAKSVKVKNHVRQILTVLSAEAEAQKELINENAIEPEEREALKTASTDAFWNSFDDDPFGHLELLENKIAPQLADADLLFLRYLGTDLAAFEKTFKRMQIVDGQAVPEGRRGLLIPKFFYEEYMKLKNARRLDKIRDALDAGRKLSDESDKELQRFLRENQSQTREIVLQLDPEQTAALTAKLQKLLGENDADVGNLLRDFFKLTDANFKQRYDFFYAEVAPMIDLYRVKIGDSLNLKSFGRSGSVESVDVKLYGTFDFKGLEKSPLAGALALIDMVSFRDLYGFLTSDRAAELKAIKAQTEVKDVAREDAEAALFGGDAQTVVETKSTDIDVQPSAGAKRETAEERNQRVYTQQEIDDGVVIHAAIVLKDGRPQAIAQAHQDIENMVAPNRAAPSETAIATLEKESQTLPFMTRAALGPVLEQEKARLKDPKVNDAAALQGLLGAYKMERTSIKPELKKDLDAVIGPARPPVWVMSWGDAAGFLGQFIGFFRIALVTIVFVVALVAMIIINNAMTLVTLQRTQTIGTLRAIGAHRAFVFAMVLVETIVLVTVFGGLGVGAGAAVVGWLHSSGIPAFRDELYFFFSGPKLVPNLTVSSIVTAGVVIFVVSLISVAVPAVMAIRVSPLRAMQESES